MDQNGSNRESIGTIFISIRHVCKENSNFFSNFNLNNNLNFDPFSLFVNTPFNAFYNVQQMQDNRKKRTFTNP